MLFDSFEFNKKYIIKRNLIHKLNGFIVLVDGGFSLWSLWTTCPVSCGGGSISRSRSCSRPMPTDGGRDCRDLGQSMETRACNIQGCPGLCEIYKLKCCNKFLIIPYQAKLCPTKFSSGKIFVTKRKIRQFRPTWIFAQ